VRKPEQRLYDAMKKAAPKEAWLQRVENIVAEGMPDVHVSGPSSECWVELKSVHRPKRPTTRLLGSEGLRPSQVNWHLKAATKAITSWILIQDDAGTKYLVEGCHAGKINELTEADLQLLSRADTWPEIHAALMEWI
jgi:hypothetical protein